LAHDYGTDSAEAAKADGLFRDASALASPDTPELALALEMYGEFLKANNRAEEAEPVLDRANMIRKKLVFRIGPKFSMDVPVFKVGGGVKAPSLLSKVEPEYSEEARSLKLSGTVLLKVVIDTDGLAKNIEL